MSRPKRYADKAITLMTNKCKPKINKLAYTDFPKLHRGHCKLEYVPKIQKGCGTIIRYCSAAEVKKLAGGHVCDCTESKRPFVMSRFLANMMRNTVKAATVFGAAYVTYDLGFWGIPKDTEATFAGACEAMPCRIDPCRSYEFLPRNRECEEEMEYLQVPIEDPCSCENPIPFDMELCCYKMKQVWNHTIIRVFDTLVNGPGAVIAHLQKLWEEFMAKECDDRCKPMTSEEVYVPDECELVDDYDEKYSKDTEEEDECNFTEETLIDKDEEEVIPPAPRCGE